MLTCISARSTVSSGAPDTGMNSSSWYFIGAIIAILILCYLMLALVKPEKF